MARIKMHIPKAKLPFYPPYEVKYRLQNGVSTIPRKIIFRFYVCIFEGILYVCFIIVSCVGLNLGAGVVLSWLIFMYVLVAN